MTKNDIMAALKAMLAEHGSTTQVAARLGVSERSVANWLAGRVPTQRANRLRIVTALRVAAQAS